MKKSVLSVAVFSLAMAGFAGAKKYDISLTAPAKAGNVQLAAGSYRVELEGDKVLFINSKNKSVSVPVKVQTEKAKFNSTAIESSEKSGEQVIDAIDLGGTNTKVEFSF